MPKKIALPRAVTARLWEIQFRKRLRVLIPDIGDPPDRTFVAAVLFKLIGLPPSEFRSMNSQQLIPLINQAIAKDSGKKEPLKWPEMAGQSRCPRPLQKTR